MCFLLCAGLCFSTMNPRSTFSIWAAGRRADRMPWEQNAISHCADLPCASSFILNIWLWPFLFIFFWSQLYSPDPAPRSDVYFGQERTKKKNLEEQEHSDAEQKRWRSLSASDNPPGKTEEMVLACDPSTCAHICKGNKTSTPGPGFLNLALLRAVWGIGEY